MVTIWEKELEEMKGKAKLNGLPIALTKFNFDSIYKYASTDFNGR